MRGDILGTTTDDLSEVNVNRLGQITGSFNFTIDPNTGWIKDCVITSGKQLVGRIRKDVIFDVNFEYWAKQVETEVAKSKPSPMYASTDENMGNQGESRYPTDVEGSPKDGYSIGVMLFTGLRVAVLQLHLKTPTAA
jgi:hypothetical protein